MKKTNKKVYEFGKGQKKVVTNGNFNHATWGVYDAFIITGKNENDAVTKMFPTDRFITGEGSMRFNDDTGHSAWIIDARIKLEDTYLKNTDWAPLAGIINFMFRCIDGVASVGNVLRPFETLCKTHNLPNGYFKRAVQLITYTIVENCNVDWSNQENVWLSLDDLDAAIDNDRKGFWMRIVDQINKWSN